jgi:vacuolar-type H+-ATPase subunit I/STV1
MLEETRKWMGQVLELLLWLVAVLVLLQILFGSDVTAFFGIDIINNLGDLVGKFGNAGLVGVIAASIVAYYIVKNRDKPGADGGSNG